MQILEYHDQRLIEAFAQEDSLDRVQRATLLNLAVHLRQWIGCVSNPEQREQIRQCVFQRAIEHQQPTADFLPPLAAIVLRRDSEVVV
jgi:hypothetical protein